MDWTEAGRIGVVVLASLGGSGALILSLSSYLGKLWATRLMETERHAHAIALEELRSSLQQSTEKELRTLQMQLEVAREAVVKEHLDRVQIYRVAIDLLAGIISNVVMEFVGKRGALTTEERHDFEARRLRVYAYLAMHAPQSVMDAHDAITDLILEILYDGRLLNWPQLRELSLKFLNEVRKDVGIHQEPISYNGTR